MVEESEVVFEGVDYDKVSRYLGEFLDKDEIKSAGFEEIVYTKKKVQRKQKKKCTTKKNKVYIRIKRLTKHPKILTIQRMLLQQNLQKNLK